MFKNTKTCISWEQNIISLQNKKILNLCFRWHILRSYHFVAEVTFKNLSAVDELLYSSRNIEAVQEQMIQIDKFKMPMEVHKEYNSLLPLEMREIQIRNGLMMVMRTCYHSWAKSITGLKEEMHSLKEEQPLVRIQM